MAAKNIVTCNETKDKSVADFVRDMTFVVNAIVLKNKKDEHMTEIRDKYLVAKTETPDSILQYAGPYFWKYREAIRNGKMAEIINNDFTSEIADFNNSLKDDASFETINVIIDKIKRTWNFFSESEKIAMIAKFKNLLSSYSTYVMADKAITSK